MASSSAKTVMLSARLWAARSPTSLLNSSCLSLETDLHGAYLSFLQENPILRSHLRSVRVVGAIKIRRFSSETHLKSDVEMTDHCGRHYAP